MSIAATNTGIVPASLAFLTIYNPSLSQSDETIEEQIVYYYSKSRDQKRHRDEDRGQDDGGREEKNEKLRQIGLAQGMVEFAKTFSDGQAVDSIETEKSRIILRELEEGWWLLASIDLTRIPNQSPTPSKPAPQQVKAELDAEYSAREVSPPALLLAQLVQAHRVFLLHHARSLTELISRLQRARFCAVLRRFWDDFIWTWDVLLHGNPAVDIFSGLKLAAGGELGYGVGEEEWGSGEREVLEGFIARTDGLVDLIVTRYGDPAPAIDVKPNPATSSVPQTSADTKDWHPGQDPRPSDGVIFSGIGAIARPCVSSISKWAESIYKQGSDAYGVKTNPVATSSRQRSKRPVVSSNTNPSQRQLQEHRRPSMEINSTPSLSQKHDFGIPAPIVRNKARSQPQQHQVPNPLHGKTPSAKVEVPAEEANGESVSGTDTFMKYMTLGLYGTKWGAVLAGTSEQHPQAPATAEKHKNDDTFGSHTKARPSSTKSAEATSGRFMIGLRGNLEDEAESDFDADEGDKGHDQDEAVERRIPNSRIMLRTLTVERIVQVAADSSSKSSPGTRTQTETAQDRLRVVVYVKRPFMFVFLFDLQTVSLAIPSFYRSLHHQLGPLQQPLLNSTSPDRVSERLSEASAPKSTVSSRSSQPIYDLVHDPYNLTVHTTIPNIPEPGFAPSSSWTRVEALSVHSQLLNVFDSTRRRPLELERTCKSSRGWWVVWMRLPHVAASQQLGRIIYREAFLIRKANDTVAPAIKSLGGSWGRSASGTSDSSGSGRKLAEGIGIDARQYIEGLVSLNR
ncbi:MAG: hypothetical protein Q9174_000815 [Haloplaca sp. 1 TL-2023]